MKIKPTMLFGRLIRLEPLSEAHTSDLSLIGLDDRIWRHMLYGDIRTSSQMGAWVKDLLARQERGSDLPFAVIYLETGRAIGATRYMDIRPDHRGLEIGGTWYAPDYQGTGVNVDAKYLLLKHAFEALGCLRVQFKTDLRNTRSQRALEGIGAVKEGVLRKHLIRSDGYIRDSIFYSIIEIEWPTVKVMLEEKLERIIKKSE